MLMVCFEAAICLAEIISWSAVSGSSNLSNPAFIMIIEVRHLLAWGPESRPGRTLKQIQCVLIVPLCARARACSCCKSGAES